MGKTDEEINYNKNNKIIEEESKEDVVYKQTEKDIENNNNNLLINHGQQNFQSQQQKVTYVPQNAIQTAHHLLLNSETTNHLPEIDQEVKLTKLNPLQSYISLQLLEVIEQLEWQKNNQEIKMLENAHYIKNNNLQEDMIEALYTKLRGINGKPDFFDSLGALRKFFDISLLGRAEGGFERTKQVETISNTNQTIEDKTNSKPGWLPRFSGGSK